MENGQKKKVAFVTLGCKVNTYEAESISASLEESGFECVSGLVPADIYVLSTCAVTNEGERKSRGQIAKILKLNPTADIYVCGCASEHNAEQFLKYPNVKYIVGTSDKLKIADVILGKIKPAHRTNIVSENVYNDSYKSKHTRARAVIKIQDGCNNFCTYCLIPYLRGRERSRSLSSIQYEIENLEKTTKEIVLTGINMSSYGTDLENQNLSLIDVCELFKGRDVKFRISSLEVNVITREFLSRLSKIKNFQPHFHLSMQSGCDRTLKSMNRKYTSDDYLSRVKLIREYFEDASITTDVIVAFPTETEADFEETLETCRKAEFLWIHVFPYSKRDGTVASKFKNVNDGVTAKLRVQKLTALAESSRSKFITERIGKTYPVIIEQEKDGCYIGHTPNYIKCYVVSDTKLNPNDEIIVKIEKTQNDGAIASKI